MAALSTIIAGAGLAISAKGMLDQKKASKNAAAAQRRSEQTQQKIRDVQTARERREQVRQGRIARASIESGAVASGTSRTSGAQSGAAQVGTNLGSNLSFLDTVQGLGRQASIFNIQAANFKSKAASAGATVGMGMSLFSNSATVGGFFQGNASPAGAGPFDFNQVAANTSGTNVGF